MKLYYCANTCSLATLIAATEAGIDVDLIKVDVFRDPHTLADGSPYGAITPKLYVPVLEFEDGSRLTEVAVQLQYLADQAPERLLAPDRLSGDRYRLQEWLNYVSSELHKSFSPWLFHPEVGQAAQDATRDKISLRLQLVEESLATGDYLMGKFSVADAYLFAILRWSSFTKVPLGVFPNIEAWQARMAARSAVAHSIKQHV